VAEILVGFRGSTRGGRVAVGRAFVKGFGANRCFDAAGAWR